MGKKSKGKAKRKGLGKTLPVKAPEQENVQNNEIEEPEGVLSPTMKKLNSSFMITEVTDGKQGQNPKVDFVITSLPTSPDRRGPHGRKSECCIWPGFKEAILSQADFPQPVFVPSVALHRIGHVNDTVGKGVFAMRSLPLGQIILSERPLLITTTKWEMNAYKSSDNMTQEEIMRVTGPEVEKVIRVSFDRMSPSDQKAYLSLANSHRNDGTPPLLGILRTNGLEPDWDRLSDLMPGVTYDEDHRLSAVCEMMSRVNHSCSPNATRNFDTSSFAFMLRAAREIEAGTEVTINYCDVFLPAAERQKRLEPYDFICTCDACKNPSESDERRTRIRAIPSADNTLDNLDDINLLDESIILPALENLLDIEKEGLQSCPQYIETLLHLHVAYAALGDAIKYRDYTLQAVKALMACGRPGSMQQAYMLTMMVTQPAMHPMWERRVKLRKGDLEVPKVGN